MSPDQWAGVLVAAALIGSAFPVRDALKGRRRRRQLEARAQAELELATTCEMCTGYLGTVLVAQRNLGALRLLLVCQGCADNGVVRGWFTVVSRKARRVA